MGQMLPDDSALPQLAIALNAETILREFRTVCSSNNHKAEPVSCEVDRIKYRPGRNCIIGYKLVLIDRESGNLREQRLCAGIYAPAEAQARFEKSLQGKLIETAYLPPVFLINNLSMVVWTFPNERKLGALLAMTDMPTLKNELLPQAVEARWGPDWKITYLTSGLVCYFPEHTCTIKAHIHLLNVRSGMTQEWEVFGKTCYDDAGARVLRHMETLWDSPSVDVRYARPLCYQSDHRLLWQEKVPGVTLESILGNSIIDDTLLARVAKAIAALHCTPLTDTRPHDVETIRERLLAVLAIVNSTRPDIASLTESTIQKLLYRIDSLDTRFNATLHGDLHSNNIMVDGNHVHLIDMDRISHGPPLAELGSFLAEIIYRACLNGKPVPWWLLTDIVESYRASVPWPVEDVEVDWYTASALIHERIFRCVTSIKPGRMEIAGLLADIAARLAPGKACRQPNRSVPASREMVHHAKA